MLDSLELKSSSLIFKRP